MKNILTIAVIVGIAYYAFANSGPDYEKIDRLFDEGKLDQLTADELAIAQTRKPKRDKLYSAN